MLIERITALPIGMFSFSLSACLGHEYLREFDRSYESAPWKIIHVCVTLPDSAYNLGMFLVP